MAVRHFTPERYFNTLGTHDAACEIQSGDQVRTTTVDARGANDQGQIVAPRPNPMTGPFHVAGAQPGQTLKITIDSIRPNRATGWTRNVIAPNVLDPDYVLAMPPRDAAHEITVWDVNLADGLAKARSESSPDRYPWLLIDPMIGCLGVAPDGGEAISTATSGPHGGNMDYVGIRGGVELYFPVAVPGALFFLGDVHALQGDGEIVGTGIEISSDVEFTVEIIPDWRIHWPRGCDGECIFALGNARPLDQATQHATTEMSRWLTQDLGLDLIAAHTMMGQCVRYELGNMYDPAYTMACKMTLSDLAIWGVDLSLLPAGRANDSR